MDQNTYVILGIHFGQNTANELGGNAVPDVPSDKVYARVRMFVAGQVYDEDFDLPEIHDSLPKDVAGYDPFITDDINSRMAEIANGTTDPSQSAITSVVKPDANDEVIGGLQS